MCNELKVYEEMEDYVGYDEYDCTPAKMYDKSEADKYIALLKDKANYNEYAYKLKSEELADTCRFYEEELRHQKYKRCLAMARICYMKSWSCLQYFSPREKYDHWKKWQDRWIELEKFYKESETEDR